MSLVDKLTDVQVGDLIVLEREDEDTVGYVVDYASDTVTICDRNTRDKKSGCIRKFKFFSPYNRSCLSGDDRNY